MILVLIVKSEELLKKDRKTDSFRTKSAYFQQFFLSNKGSFGIPLFEKFPSFDPNKGKIPLFGLHTVKYSSLETHCVAFEGWHQANETKKEGGI